MDYISVKQAAEKWDMSERFVQRRCTEGRIEGAVKFGRSWMIPTNAKKPDDMRTKDKSSDAEKPITAGQQKRSYNIMPLMNAAFPIGKCREFIDSIEDKDEKRIAEAEYYYYTGDAKKCADIAEKYIDSEFFELRASALWLYSFANLLMGRIHQVRKSLKAIRIIYENTTDSSPLLEKAVAVCLYNSIYTHFHVFYPEGFPQAQTYVHALPPGLRLFVLFNQAHYAFANNLYGVTAGVAETGLVLDDECYPIPSIYLHIACAMSYIHMGYTEMSKKHLLTAWEYAKSDNLLGPFGECQGLLCGMLETLFKKSEPEEFRRMIKIAKQHSAGWIKIHNEVTGDKIPSDLTPTEYVVCMLVARDWSSKEIAAHLKITANAVHKSVSDAMSKMCITKRADIKKIMLQK